VSGRRPAPSEGRADAAGSDDGDVHERDGGSWECEWTA
jgi:hypothetical protein